MEDKKRLITAILFIIMALLFTWILLPTFSFAQNSAVKIEQAWAKPTLIGRDMGVVYLTIENISDEARSLIAAQTDVAERTEIHTHMHGEDGTMQMRQLETLELAPSAAKTFKPGGLHFMLFGLKQPLKEGDEFTMTLKFDDESAEKIHVMVRENG